MKSLQFNIIKMSYQMLHWNQNQNLNCHLILPLMTTWDLGADWHKLSWMTSHNAINIPAMTMCQKCALYLNTCGWLRQETPGVGDSSLIGHFYYEGKWELSLLLSCYVAWIESAKLLLIAQISPLELYIWITYLWGVRLGLPNDVMHDLVRTC